MPCGTAAVVGALVAILVGALAAPAAAATAATAATVGSPFANNGTVLG